MGNLTKMTLAAMLAVSLVACGGAATGGGTGDSGAGDAQEAKSGGWQFSGEGSGSALTEDEAATFTAAMSEVKDASFEPVSVIAHQVVAGMNYAYLCKDAAAGEWDVVVIYKDLEGNASFTCANAIDPADVHVIAGGEEEAVGAWAAPTPAEGLPLPADAQTAFDAAKDQIFSENAGSGMIEPQALLATQLVSGTNYKILCLGTQAASAEKPWSIYVVELYQDLEGKVSVTSADVLDINYYVTAA